MNLRLLEFLVESRHKVLFRIISLFGMKARVSGCLSAQAGVGFDERGTESTVQESKSRNSSICVAFRGFLRFSHLSVFFVSFSAFRLFAIVCAVCTFGYFAVFGDFSDLRKLNDNFQ